MKNLSDYLSSEYSWWERESEYSLEHLNETIPTAENMRIIFLCEWCENYHVAELKDIRLDGEGNYQFCCPEEEQEWGECEKYLYADYLPEELGEIFKTSSFEKNYVDEDDSVEEEEK